MTEEFAGEFLESFAWKTVIKCVAVSISHAYQTEDDSLSAERYPKQHQRSPWPQKQRSMQWRAKEVYSLFIVI